MDYKGTGIHLFKRLAVFAVPEVVLFLNYAFSKHAVNADGVLHPTDRALGLAIFTCLFLIGWGIYLLIDMVLLSKKSEKSKARANMYLLIFVIVGMTALLINL